MLEESVTGQIISIDKDKMEVVLRDMKTGMDKTIIVKSNMLSSLKTGEEVTVMLGQGTNIATAVKAAE